MHRESNQPSSVNIITGIISNILHYDLNIAISYIRYKLFECILYIISMSLDKDRYIEDSSEYKSKIYTIVNRLKYNKMS